MRVKCAFCGERFSAWEDWAYALQDGDRKRLFCRWNHLQAYRRAKETAPRAGTKAVRCLETGEVYPSAAAAADAIGAGYTDLTRAARIGCSCRGRHWRYLQEEGEP